MVQCFAPYKYCAVDKYNVIEAQVWEMGRNNIRSCAASLRSRYVLLHTTSGILRFESLEKAELLDNLMLTLKKPQDPHLIQLMITQLPTGKFFFR